MKKFKEHLLFAGFHYTVCGRRAKGLVTFDFGDDVDPALVCLICQRSEHWARHLEAVEDPSGMLEDEAWVVDDF